MTPQTGSLQWPFEYKLCPELSTPISQDVLNANQIFTKTSDSAETNTIMYKQMRMIFKD